MTTETEARLTALLEAARARQGDAILRDRDRLTLFLMGEAPELADQVRALAIALSLDATWQLGAAPGAEATQALIVEVARRANVQSGAAGEAVRVAAGMAGVVDMPPAAPPPPIPEPQPRGATDDAWVGETQIAGTAAPDVGQAPRGGTSGGGGAQDPLARIMGMLRGFGGGQGGAPSFDLKALLKNKWVLIGIGVVAVAMFLGDDPAPQQQPMQPDRPAVPGGGGGGQQQAGGVPDLVNPQGGGALPQLVLQTYEGNPFVAFRLPTQEGGVQGSVLVSAQGWDSGVIVAFSPVGQSEAQTLSTLQPARLVQQEQRVIRLIQPEWQFDNVGIRDICVSFEQHPSAADVTFRGSAMCVYGAGCQQVIGCGRVPQ